MKRSELCSLENEARKAALDSQTYPTWREFQMSGHSVQLKISQGLGRMAGLMAIYYVDGKRASYKNVSTLCEGQP